jgi:hypothetical protein
MASKEEGVLNIMNALLGSTLGRHLLPELSTPGVLPYTKGGRQD